MRSFRLLGFDARTIDIPPVYSVDVSVWPRIDDKNWLNIVAQISKEMMRESDTIVNYLNLLSCIPARWLTRDDLLADIRGKLVAITIGHNHSKRLERLYPDLFRWYSCALTQDDLIRAGWVCLGYDVVDTMLNTSWIRVAVESGITPVGIRFGLFRNERRASSSIRVANNQVPEHSPFEVVAVFGAAEPASPSATGLPRATATTRITS